MANATTMSSAVTVDDAASLTEAIWGGGRIVARPDLDPATIIDAALAAGATRITWVAWAEDTVPDHPAVSAADPLNAVAYGTLADTGGDTVVVLDRSSLNPFGSPGDRFALLGCAPRALATIRRMS